MMKKANENCSWEIETLISTAAETISRELRAVRWSAIDLSRVPSRGGLLRNAER